MRLSHPVMSISSSGMGSTGPSPVVVHGLCEVFDLLVGGVPVHHARSFVVLRLAAQYGGAVLVGRQLVGLVDGDQARYFHGKVGRFPQVVEFRPGAVVELGVMPDVDVDLARRFRLGRRRTGVVLHDGGSGLDLRPAAREPEPVLRVFVNDGGSVRQEDGAIGPALFLDEPGQHGQFSLFVVDADRVFGAPGYFGLWHSVSP